MYSKFISDPACEHPFDVLTALEAFLLSGDGAALVIITRVKGGGVRREGSMMAVSERGEFAGYVSGGCIDADVIRQSRAAICAGENRKVLYGEGSPFIDLPLPCGGAIEVAIRPSPPLAVIQEMINRLGRERAPFQIHLPPDDAEPGAVEVVSLSSLTPVSDAKGMVQLPSYLPKLRIRVAGRGADFLAFSKIVATCRHDLVLQSTDAAILDQIPVSKHISRQLLTTPRHLPANEDDAWTAFALLFHDADWEAPLLMDAFNGDAFYIGAVGSRRAHEARLLALRNLGCSQENMARIHAPIGLLHGMRDASSLAISSLAEIIQGFRKAFP